MAHNKFLKHVFSFDNIIVIYPKIRQQILQIFQYLSNIFKYCNFKKTYHKSFLSLHIRSAKFGFNCTLLHIIWMLMQTFCMPIFRSFLLAHFTPIDWLTDHVAILCFPEIKRLIDYKFKKLLFKLIIRFLTSPNKEHLTVLPGPSKL
jgi:hypothetical protein